MTSLPRAMRMPISYCAGARGQRRADDGDAQLLAHHADADRGCGLLVLRDRFERLAGDAAVDRAPDQEAAEPHDERDAVKVPLVGELQRVPGMAGKLLR